MHTEIEMLAIDAEYYEEELKTAIYQIRRAVAYLESIVTHDTDMITLFNQAKLENTAASVLAQLRAYLKTVDKS